jgi:hypothetical protein
MTAGQKIIYPKVGLLELVKQLSNASQACAAEIATLHNG